MKRIVFIPGVMGSELKEGKLFGGSSRWFTFNNKSVKRLKMEPGKKDNINPGKPLAYGYQVFGNIVKENIVYARIIELLKNLNIEDYVFHPYGYDWRKDLWDTCLDLDALLKQFKNDEIYIVAHSMGGLLAHTYCQWASEKKVLPNIKRIITIGTPWNGSPDAFKVLKYGVEDKGRFFPNSTITRDISRTFPSSYQLLPSSKYCLDNKYLMKEGKDLRWLDCMNLIENLEGCTLKSIDSMNNKIHDSLILPWPDTIEHYNIIGVNQGAIGTLKLGLNDEDRIEEPVDGDGVVPLKSAIPNFNSKSVVYSYAKHQGLVLHEPVLQWVKQLLEDGKTDVIEGIFTNYEPRTDWVMDKIDCPVDVFVKGEEESINQPSDDITRHTIGEATYLIYNNPKATTIEVEAYDDGRTSIETINIEKGKAKTITKFPSLDADPSRKTVIDVQFQDNRPITRVFTSDEDNVSEIEITGIIVDVPETRISEPPKTMIKLVAIGKGKDFHYDEKGVNVTFTIKEPNFQCLETRYKINGGTWRRYEGEVNLTVDNGLINGKNIIEYYSIDVHDNAETIKKKVLYYEPKPRIFYKVRLNPDSGGNLAFEELFEGVRTYTYNYKVGKDTEEVVNKNQINFKPYEDKEIFVQAEDMFGRKSEYERFDLSFNEIAEIIWDEKGFDGVINDIVKLIPQIDDKELVSVHVGKNEKDLYDTIPKSAKTLIIKLSNAEYIIDLMPKLEIYLDFHSEKIKREEKNIKISFLIYDAEGNSIKDINPSVKYILMPIKNVDMDTKYPAVSSNGKGLYTFNVPVEKLSKEVKKIKFEFRDVLYRIKPIDTRFFKLE